MIIPLKKTGTTKLLVMPDMHVPFEDKRTLRAVEKYMRTEAWDGLVYLGDVLDFNCVSQHNVANLRAVSGQTVAKDYRAANELLDRHALIVGDGVSMVWIQGNHDERIERVINAVPTLEGSLEVENNIDLIKSGRMQYVKFWQTGEIVEMGKAAFIHGNYVNEFHAKQTVLAYGRNVFYGHTHDVQMYSKVWAGAETICAQSLGCLCRLDQAYMRGRPSKWVQAFGVFHFLPNGNFTYYTPMIIDHQFVGPDGVLYKG